MSWDILKIPVYEKYKNQWIESHPLNMGEYTWSYLFENGKQIRPKLFCDLCNYIDDKKQINVELAFVIECIHVTSLVLDDSPWMDNSNTRRNRETLHFKFSQTQVLHICFDILKLALQIWTNNKPTNISSKKWNEIIIVKLYRLSLGQIYDLEKTNTLFELASLKTGVLFELITETVAICNDLDIKYWKIWGNYFGVLYQLKDDWNDIDEDIIQCNRNPFVESYDLTILQYSKILAFIKLENEWFKRPFGKYLHDYFSQDIKLKIDFDDELYNIPYLNLNSKKLFLMTDNILIKNLIRERIMNVNNGWSSTSQIILRYFNDDFLDFSLSDIIKICFDNIDTDFNLWKINEKDWEISLIDFFGKVYNVIG